MPRVLLLIAAALGLFAAPPHADLQQVQSVYILPMSGGLHQHLTNHLVKLGLFQVVADPLRADSVLTDRLGTAFETQLSDWDAEDARRNPPPADQQKVKAEKKEGEEAPFELMSRQTTSAISRGRGTLFLVDRKSRRVIWSIYKKSQSNLPDQLDKVAARVAQQLREDAGKKR